MDFRGFLRPCEAMRQVKKQQIKVKFWIWGPRTVYYNMTFAQNSFQKSLHPTEMRAFSAIPNIECICKR